MNHTPLLKIFKNYLSDELLSQDEYNDVINNISATKNVVKYIIDKEYVTSEKFSSSISETFKLNIFSLKNFKVDEDLISLFDEKIIKKYQFIPISKEGNKIKLAISNPFDQIAKAEVQLRLSNEYIVILELGDYNEINKCINKLYEEKMDYGNFSDDDLAALEFEIDDSKEDEINEIVANDAPIVKLSNKILLDSIAMEASDIHIEPYEKEYRIRYRVDGILKTKIEPKRSLETKLSARFKIMSGCDISEKRKPQDGRIKLKLSNTKSVDFRVNFLPTLFGEKIVLRKLDASSAQMGIEHLGFEDYQKNLYMDALNKPQGMILVTGPTGSGKTVSLYTGLNIINTEEINISTAEDPVEINLSGINQVNVNAKQGLTFAEALRSFLRQDPDVIMVGEIRDLETANIAVKAAQTGHMVMSTLHTNSAAETITRLLNMGVPSFNVATVINLIIAQRLARKLCKECKIKSNLPDKILLESGFSKEQLLKKENIFEPNKKGCPHCNNGYKGRVGIYEVVKITKPLSESILNGDTAIDFSNIQKEEGFNNLRDSAIIKVLDGLTSLEEIVRVTQL